MKTEIISIGTEVLMGNILNTNAQNLSKICIENGHYVYFQSVVGDNYERAVNVLTTAFERSELIIVSGGLGPTEDDITLKVVADTLGKELVYDKNIEKYLVKYINRDKIPQNIYKQAYKIADSILLPNDHGSAFGNLVFTENKKCIVVLPGPPNECLPMFKNYAIPELADFANSVVVSKIIKLHNIGEARAVEMVDHLIKNQDDPTIAPYCKFMEVQFRITSSNDNISIANKKIDKVIKNFDEIFGKNIYSYNENFNIEDEIYRLLKENNYTISLAESCTGGIVTSKLVNVSGISSYLKESYVTYSDTSKINILGVKSKTIDKYSSVSKEVVKEMLDGLYNLTKSDICVAISGVSGPGNDLRDNQQGLTIIGVKVAYRYEILTYSFDGDRNQNRNMATTAALIQLRNKIYNLKNNYLSLYETK